MSWYRRFRLRLVKVQRERLWSWIKVPGVCSDPLIRKSILQFTSLCIWFNHSNDQTYNYLVLLVGHTNKKLNWCSASCVNSVMVYYFIRQCSFILDLHSEPKYCSNFFLFHTLAKTFPHVLQQDPAPIQLASILQTSICSCAGPSLKLGYHNACLQVFSPNQSKLCIFID